MSAHVPTEVSKLDPPAVKRPPARYVDVGAADLVSIDTGGCDQEGQDDKEEEMRRRDDRDKGDGITEEANDGLQNDDEVNEQEKNGSHLQAPRQKRTKKSSKERIEELKVCNAKHGLVRVSRKQKIRVLETFAQRCYLLVAGEEMDI